MGSGLVIVRFSQLEATSLSDSGKLSTFLKTLTHANPMIKLQLIISIGYQFM